MLKKQGLSAVRYNQIANFAMAQSEINIAIGNRDPKLYFAHVRAQVNGGEIKYGGITDPAELEQNMAQNCIPAARWMGDGMTFDEFLSERRQLMAARMRAWFEKI